MPDAVATRLVRKLGLLQSPSKDAMKAFRRRTRELEPQCLSLDQAAMKAAGEIFPAEFQPTRYAGHADPIETLLADIDNL